MTHEEIRDSLEAYALGALDDDEARVVGAHVADCAECREELRGLQDTVLRLASAEASSQTVWERILRRIRWSPNE